LVCGDDLDKLHLWLINMPIVAQKLPVLSFILGDIEPKMYF
jgi:hypothetical protein